MRRIESFSAFAFWLPEMMQNIDVLQIVIS